MPFKKLTSGTNTVPAGNPNNHVNTPNKKTFVFDDLTLNMIKVLCARKKIELEKINNIEYSKSRPIINLKCLQGMENIPWS
jgi:hypothetical protein